MAASGLLSPPEEIHNIIVPLHFYNLRVLQLWEWITSEPIFQTLLRAVSMEHWIALGSFCLSTFS